MKTKISRIGKRSLSLVITLMMIVSMMLVGMVSASAAISEWHIVGSQTNNSNMTWTFASSPTISGNVGSYTLTTNGNTNKLVAVESSARYLCTVNQTLTSGVKSNALSWYAGASSDPYTKWANFSSATTADGTNAQLKYTPSSSAESVTFTISSDGSYNYVTVTENIDTTPTDKTFYITGRFGVKDDNGSWIYAGGSATGWNSGKTSDIVFTKESDTLYSLDTNLTISDLSAYSSDLDAAWYLRIADGETIYYTASTSDIILTADSAGTKYATGTSSNKGFYFNDTDTSGNVILYFDTSTNEFYFNIEGSDDPIVDTTKSSYIKNTSALWIDANPSSETATSTLIKWNNKSGSSGGTRTNYIFYVPKNVDLTNAVIYNGFSSAVTFGSTSIAANSSGTVSLTVGSTYSTGQGTVEVMQGSTNAMFIEQSKGDLPTATGAGETKSSVKISGGSIITMTNDTDTAVFSDALVIDNIKGRGNSSWEASNEIFGKYAFNMKLDKATNLFGMDKAEGSKSKSWCLLANNADESMLRNALTYDLANALGLPYAPEFRFVDIYDNNVYLGSYLVTEKVDVGDKKLIKGEAFDDINAEEIDEYNDANGTEFEINEDAQVQSGSVSSAGSYQYNDIYSGLDITVSDPTYDTRGTYLLEFEIAKRVDAEASWFVSSKGQNVVVKSPEFATKNQVKFVQEKFNAMESAIFSGADVSELSKYMDVESFVKMYLIQELAANLDSAATSYYIMLDCSNGADNARFVASPVWDYDWAYGQYTLKSDNSNIKYAVDGSALHPEDPEKWLAKIKSIDASESNTGTYSIQSKLADTNSSFQSLIKKVWNDEFYSTIKTYYTDDGQIDQWYDQISASVSMNERRWGFIANDPITSWGSKDTGNLHSVAVEYLKSDWTETRANWLNTQIQNYADYTVTKLATPTVKAYTSDGAELTGSIEAGSTYIIKATTDDPYVTYVLYNGDTVVDSNSTGEFEITAVEGEYNYTVKTTFDSVESSASDVVTVTVVKPAGSGDYTITKTASNYGTISFTTSSDVVAGTANEGDTVTVTVKTLSGYICTGITVEAADASVDVTTNDDGTYTFTMPASNVTITASYEATVVKYTVTGVASKGVLTFSNTNAQAGETITVTITPNDGYICSSISATDADGNEVKLEKTNSTKYVFVMPESNVTVKAVFEVYTPDTEHTFTVYFKSPSSFAYQPKVSLDGDAYVSMTKGQELGKIYSGAITMYWYSAEFTVDTSTTHTLTFKTTRTNLNASITDFFTEDTYYLAVDNIMSGTEVVDLTHKDEYIRNYYRSATHMVYPYNGVDDNTDNTLGFTNIGGVRYKMGSYIENNVDVSGVSTIVTSYSIKSATLMQQVAAGLVETSDLQSALLDVNLDGVINVTDATMMQKSLVGA